MHMHMCVDCAACGLERPTHVHIHMYTDCICSVTLTSSNFIISVHGMLYSCTWFWHITHGVHVQSCGIVTEVDQSIHLGWNCLRWSMHLGWNSMLEPITAMILVYFCRLVKSQDLLRKQEEEVSILACSPHNTNKMYIQFLIVWLASPSLMVNTGGTRERHVPSPRSSSVYHYGRSS